MNVYDLAHNLARTLKKSPEYIEFKKAQEAINQDPQAKKMLKDLRSKQLEVQALKFSGKPVDEVTKKLENLYGIIGHNTLIQKYIETEERFAVLMMDIQEIIVDGIDLDLNLDETE